MIKNISVYFFSLYKKKNKCLFLPSSSASFVIYIKKIIKKSTYGILSKYMKKKIITEALKFNKEMKQKKRIKHVLSNLGISHHRT